MLTQHGKKVIIKDKPIIIQEVKKEYGNIFQYEIIDNWIKKIVRKIWESLFSYL